MRRNISSFLTALAGFLFLVCGAVVLTLNLRSIYYREIEQQNLVQETGLSEAEIRANYDALIDYNLITKGIDTLEFPTLPMSEHGRIHFEEVKVIFVRIQYLFCFMGILFLIGLLRKLRQREYCFLKLMAAMTWGIPAVLGSLIILFWDQVFVIFHKIFFQNDYWLFDPVIDPVILILPDSFFSHCAIVILLLVAAGGIMSLIAYCLLKRHTTDVSQNGALLQNGQSPAFDVRRMK